MGAGRVSVSYSRCTSRDISHLILTVVVIVVTSPFNSPDKLESKGNSRTMNKASPMVPIDMDRIKMIESSGNPRAFNMRSGCRGLYQVSPILLKEWNNVHPDDKHFPDALFKPEVNKKIAYWYMLQRLPGILKAHSIPVTVENLLIAYNFGPNNLRKYLIGEIPQLPEETIAYIYKYRNNL